MVYFASFNPPVRVSGLIPHLVSRIPHPSGTPHHPSRLLKPFTHHPLPITHYPSRLLKPITHHRFWRIADATAAEYDVGIRAKAKGNLERGYHCVLSPFALVMWGGEGVRGKNWSENK